MTKITWFILLLWAVVTVLFCCVSYRLGERLAEVKAEKHIIEVFGEIK